MVWRRKSDAVTPAAIITQRRRVPGVGGETGNIGTILMLRSVGRRLTLNCQPMSRSRKSKKRGGSSPQATVLKSGSGAGFTFEDKVAAVLAIEMLAGIKSLGLHWGSLNRIERQAADWEPHGDLLLTTTDGKGELVHCGVSVKSNRRITANGVDAESAQGLWTVLGKPAFRQDIDLLGLFCSELPKKISDQLHAHCQQAREQTPARLDQKIPQANLRKIRDSFRGPAGGPAKGQPGYVLARLIPREFDFENATSRVEAETIRLCGEILLPQFIQPNSAQLLWERCLALAADLRTKGGEISRERLADKLRGEFRLKDDPADVSVWSQIRANSRAAREQIRTTLTGGLALARTTESAALKKTLSASRAMHVLGESGSGKSALVLRHLEAQSNAEIVWCKAEHFGDLLKTVPHLVDAARRTRRQSGFLVIDSVEACFADDQLRQIGRAVAMLTSGDAPVWKVILICQTSEWTRVARGLVKELAAHDVLSARYECGDLSREDLEVVYAASRSIHQLAVRGELRRLLRSPKVLDLLLAGQLAENLALAGEADLVDWWWVETVRGGKPIADEERAARQIAARMADDLTSEVSPDATDVPAAAIESLIKRRVLSRTPDGRLRFDHDLLADWSRVMHLRSLGDAVLDFMRSRAENPPWLRAIRLLSQHWLERTADLERWRAVVTACSTAAKQRDEPTAENLQVLDPWLEGVAFCADSGRAVGLIRTELLVHDGWLLRRFLRRLLYVGTLPDPVMQQRIRAIDPDTALSVAEMFRLPLYPVWEPVVAFLLSIPEEATEFVPLELAEMATMWARLDEYVKLNWRELADLVLLNGEKELRREVAGVYRHEGGTIRLGRGNKSRTSIYAAAVLAASQNPARSAKLVLKAAGRIDWEAGDVNANADEQWRGEYHEPPFFIGSGRLIKSPPESWPDGPRRRTSHDFLHAWMQSSTAHLLYQKDPMAACEATLGFLLDWPKSELRDRHSSLAEHHGFVFDSDRMSPATWSRGPFILFLRHDPRPAADMIVRLINFATDRYEDWWPYETRVETERIVFARGEAVWKGNQQVFAWFRYHMNTPAVVTCALMALEKWLDEQVEAGKPISPVLDAMVEQGRSLAFAGVLIAIGKRHPTLFTTELKPLLFHRVLYMHDVHAVNDDFGGGAGLFDGKVINDLRHKWNQLPGRRVHLKDACVRWLLSKSEFAPVFAEISARWRADAYKLPADSGDRLILLRWASDFDRATWKEVTLPDGREVWQNDRPAELRDVSGEQEGARRLSLLTIPMECANLLAKRPHLADSHLAEIVQQLRNWGEYEKPIPKEDDDGMGSDFHDHRHARAGLIAVVLCLGDAWLNQHPEERTWLEGEIAKQLADPPRIRIFTPDDTHDDWESFMARALIRCWASAPRERDRRGVVASFVTALRYRTVAHVFQEAFLVRAKLGKGYRELEAFALALAVQRQKFSKLQFIGTQRKTDGEALKKWGNTWPRRFAEGNGPKWQGDWSKIEVKQRFVHENDEFRASSGRRRLKLRRRDFGLDMGIIIAAFGHLPALAEAPTKAERNHWLHVTQEVLGVFERTLPSVTKKTADFEWAYDHWRADEDVMNLVAQRVFETIPVEARKLWQPVLGLPASAHHHITRLLTQILLRALQADPPWIAQLLPLWHEMVEYFSKSSQHPAARNQDHREVWKVLLFYGSPISSTGEKFFRPIVEDLRQFFESHIKLIAGDAYEQPALARFLTTKAGEELLIDALVWFCPSWEQASNYFWERATEDGGLERLLEHAWKTMFSQVRQNPAAFSAFRILTMNLATRQSGIALQVQERIGKAF